MNCKKCNTELEDQTSFCPKCGKSQTGLSRSKKVLFIILGAFAIICFIGALAGSDETVEASVNTVAQEKQEPKQEKYKASDYVSYSKQDKIDLFARELLLKPSQEDIKALAQALFSDDQETFNTYYIIGVHKTYGASVSDKIIEELYATDINKQIALKLALVESEKKEAVNAAKDQIIIEEDFTFTTEGNYDYVKGSISNNSNKTIRYVEIIAKYKDANGKVIDSEYTNEVNIGPGESRYFTIMHKSVPGSTKVSLSLNDLRFK